MLFACLRHKFDSKDLIVSATLWKSMKLAFSQVDAGKTTWGATQGKAVYGLDKGKWRKLSVGNHVTSGDAGVWLIRNGLIYIRTGARKNRRLGTSWRRVPGKLTQIDSGPKGIVCGVNKYQNIYCRLGIAARTPWGKSWLHVPGKLKYISCGDYGHWGVNKYNKIYFRMAVTRSRPGGIRWKYIPGRLSQIEAGQYGQVVGVNTRKQLYVRTGVTERRPWGTRWKKVKGMNLWSHVTVGKGVLLALNARHTLYRSTLQAAGGKLLLLNEISLYSYVLN